MDSWLIVLNNVTVGVPSRLTDSYQDDDVTIHYTNVGFTPSSRASGGVLIGLRPILIDHDGDDAIMTTVPSPEGLPESDVG